MKIDLTGEFLGYQRLGMRDCTVVRVPPHVHGLYTGMWAHIGQEQHQIVATIPGEPVIAIEGRHEPTDVAVLLLRPVKNSDT